MIQPTAAAVNWKPSLNPLSIRRRLAQFVLAFFAAMKQQVIAMQSYTSRAHSAVGLALS
jgi:hypothetical protein